MAYTLINWLQLIRLPAGFSVMSNVFIAHTIATQGNIQPYILSLTLIASLCLYFGGMVLNDCFDYKEDSLGRPHRPLPSKKINLNTAWAVGFLLLISGCLVAALVNPRMMIISLLLALLILLYDSNRLSGWSSALTMGLCRYTNWLMALSIFPLSTNSLLLPIPILIYIIGLTRLSQMETSLVTRMRVHEIQVLLIASVFCLLIIANVSVLSVILLIILSFYYLSLLTPLFKPHCSENIQYIVSRLIFGLIPLDATYGLLFGYWGMSVFILLLIPLPKLTGQKLYVS